MEPMTPNQQQPVLDAEARAKAGDFSGVPAIVQAIDHANQDVRLRAAYVAGRIGLAQAIEPLATMARRDPVSPNRNQAIYSLSAIGRPAVVPALIDALNDEDVERRMDARIALYQMLGPDVFAPMVEEDEGEGPDPEEIDRVTDWWAERASTFDPARAYAFGVPASPGVFIEQVAAADSSLPDAYLNALTDWTGQDFGQEPLAQVQVKWRQWWAAEARKYEPGRRYFFGHPVP
jgi:hypothetical protein